MLYLAQDFGEVFDGGGRDAEVLQRVQRHTLRHVQATHVVQLEAQPLQIRTTLDADSRQFLASDGYRQKRKANIAEKSVAPVLRCMIPRDVWTAELCTTKLQMRRFYKLSGQEFQHKKNQSAEILH